MDLKQKKKLKSTLSSILSKENITFKEIDSIKKDERKDSVNNELLRINKIALQWALKNKVITADELKDEKFITDNKPLSDFIAEAGIGALGLGGAAVVYNMVAAPVFLGFGGGIAAVGIAGGTVIAAPVIVAGLFMYGKAYYDNKKQIEELLEYFNKEKEKIQNFYFSKINKLQSDKPINQNKETIKPNSNIQKEIPSPKKSVKEEAKPKVEQIEKDRDYDRCVVRYDEKLKACTIKYEDSLRDKKDGLHGKTFKSFVDKIPPIIGHDIFNVSKVEIVFVGEKADFTELKQACKVFKESDMIDIKIVFREITKIGYKS